MRHETGLNVHGTTIQKEWLLTENIKKNSIGQIIETDHSDFKSEAKLKDPKNINERKYHPFRDWISNEIFRRVEPQKRTMGEYFRDELSE